METFAKLLVMLLAINGAPVLAARICRSHGALPVDLGMRRPDGRPLFGESKTWRGVLSALGMSCALSVFFGYGAWFGLMLGLLAMVGDIISSFIKRRMGLNPSAQCTGLDQLPESFLPSVYAVEALGLDCWWILLLPLTFMLLEIIISKPLFILKIRNRPH
jgi:CDP-2,3-bis-(O-geranylgeranyl)-sn-glycerol synthase